MEYESVIGLEVHVQLSTASKIFCEASTEFGADPNSHIDPLTFGLPGALPVLNEKVVESAIMMGLALNCQIREFNQFARKHYFYPDLPKGYQISQYEEPICEHGSLEIRMDEVVRTVGITRIHMEEDAGKNIHDSRTQSSLVDLNRAGVPLLEIVSEPDLRSAVEASAYLKTLRRIARYLGVSDGNMEEGSLRCDANISLRPRGQLEFGTRTEIKNINSFKFVERAIGYEIARQLSILKSGGTVTQETRLFDSGSGTTHPMRSKEESADYRYFPDPDLPALRIEESYIREIRGKMPKLPRELELLMTEQLGLSEYDAAVLTAERDEAEYFLKVHDGCGNAKAAANWVSSELFGLLKRDGISISESPITATQLSRLIALIDDGTISGKMAKEIFEEMFSSGTDPEAIIEQKGLQQITDEDEILNLVRQAIEQNEEQFKEFLGGRDKLQGFFVGQVMKLSKGSANPQLVNEILAAEVERQKKQRDA